MAVKTDITDLIIMRARYMQARWHPDLTWWCSPLGRWVDARIDALNKEIERRKAEERAYRGGKKTGIGQRPDQNA